VGRGIVAVGAVALASACSSSSSSLGPGQTPPPATPSVTPTAVTGLTALSFGTFPSTADGWAALNLCEQWASLRSQYVANLKTDTPHQLEVWFSGSAWTAAYGDESPLKVDPVYGNISLAFGQTTAVDTASIANADTLDTACAAAD
jgi:hypothetical protein